jgi:hypothetical protein
MDYPCAFFPHVIVRVGTTGGVRDRVESIGESGGEDLFWFYLFACLEEGLNG